eukprot:TRINITY_DN11736_c0_g2_i2.p1 TRINITY_DN11736_c0_g2~~TRINITY_DN11736_c0_g2_i2.p1  ORF type:complete len:197 (+),score=19.74 TRINITY_DN11736_c0_g2_i2:89-679(+)
MCIRDRRRIVQCGRHYKTKALTSDSSHQSKVSKKIGNRWDEELEKCTSKEVRSQFIKRYKEITGDPRRNKVDLSRRFQYEIRNCTGARGPTLYTHKPARQKSICLKNSVQASETVLKYPKRRHGSVLPKRESQILEGDVDENVYKEFQEIVNNGKLMMRVKRNRARQLQNRHRSTFRRLYDKSLDAHGKSADVFRA